MSCYWFYFPLAQKHSIKFAQNKYANNNSELFSEKSWEKALFSHRKAEPWTQNRESATEVNSNQKDPDAAHDGAPEDLSFICNKTKQSEEL